MDIIRKPTLKESIQNLAHRDEFQVIISFIKDERDRFFSDLRQTKDTNDVMKIAGSISTLDELVSLFETIE